MKAPEYRAEYSATDRSVCVRCSNGIRKSGVRLGIVEKSSTRDGKAIDWLHPPCFFRKKPNVDVDKIKRFHDLLWADQIRIRKVSAGRKDATDESENGTLSEDEDPTSKKGKNKHGSDGDASPSKKSKTVAADGLDGSGKSQSSAIRECTEDLAQLPVKAILGGNNYHVPVTDKAEKTEDRQKMSLEVENLDVLRVKKRKPGNRVDYRKAKPGSNFEKEKRRPGKPIDKDRFIIRLKSQLSSVNREATAMGMLAAKNEARVRLLEKENAALKAQLEERSAQLTTAQNST